MFTPNLEQQYHLDANESRVNKLAECLWNAQNEAEYDPMHPLWEHFDDPIKDEYVAAASYLLLVNDGMIH